MLLLTDSRLRDARGCQRKHHLRYDLGIRPVHVDDALRFGTLTHRGLEGMWKKWAGMPFDPAPTDGEPDPFEKAKANALLQGYELRWENEPYEILEVEVPFETELRNPLTGRPSQTWRLAGVIDKIVRDRRDDRILIVEHKTSSESIEPGSEYWRRLRMDSQVSMYYEGARSLGYDVAGCLYDVLGKPGQRPFKKAAEIKLKKDGTPCANQHLADETPEQYRARVAEAIAADPNRYYQRGEVVRLESEMSEFLYDIWQTAQQIRESELAGRFPRNPNNCVKFGKTCSYFPICTGEASAEDPTLFIRSSDIHPELSHP